MKRGLLLFLMIGFLSISKNAEGEQLESVISKNKIGQYQISATIAFQPVVRTTNLKAEGYVFKRFLINYVQVRKNQPARIYYANEDVMPPCIFVHVPAYPLPREIVQLKSQSSLRALLGREQEQSRLYLRWSFFRITSGLVKVMHIRASKQEADGIGAISVYEADAKLSQFNFGAGPREK